MKNLHSITLHVQGTVTQTIKLNDDSPMTEVELVECIKDGRIVTSIGHGDNNGRVYWIGLGDSFKEIGTVVAQEAQDDFEISLSEDEELMDEVYITGERPTDTYESDDHDA